MLVALSAFSAGDEISKWLSSSLQIPKKGSTVWTIVITTGHIGKDPELAEAIQSEVVRVMSQVGSPGDLVRVRGAEMGFWYDSGLHAIEKLADHLPTAPAPNSKGGRDIEKILSIAAEEAKGPVLVFSPGGSLLPVDGRGALVGGDGSVSGFFPPLRRSFSLKTKSGVRPAQVSILTRERWFTGEKDRVPLPFIGINSPSVSSPRTVNGPRVGAAQEPNWMPMALGASIATIVILGALLLRKTSGHPANPIVDPVEGTELSQLQEYVKNLQKRLDFATQELEESVSRATNQDQVEQLELRREIAKQTQLLLNWDQLAIGYLDGIDRALQTESLSEAERTTWMRTRRHFVDRIQEMGLDEIRPEVGKEPSLGFHRIDHYTSPTADVKAGQVANIVSSGFRRGDLVIRQALVAVAGERL